jgi:hypothetical protein
MSHESVGVGRVGLLHVVKAAEILRRDKRDFNGKDVSMNIRWVSWWVG